MNIIRNLKTMRATKRPQNKCKSCGYTWYPRGKHISSKCPSCGSNKVSTVGGGSLIVGAIILGYIIFNDNNNDDKHSKSVSSKRNLQSSLAASPTAPNSVTHQYTVSKQPSEARSQQDKEELDKYRSEEIRNEESKLNQASTWSADWGNGVQALLTTGKCSDIEFSGQGYIYDISVTIPISRLKNPSDAWSISGKNATTVIGCWLKNPDGLLHAIMRRKKDGKIWEQDINLNDGSWKNL